MAKEKENKGEEVKKEEEKKEEEKKVEGKKEDEIQEIVLKVDMHCEACARKVARSLKGFQGVEEVKADSKASKVVIKGKNADPLKVCERIQKKSGRKVELISPLPKPPEENKKEEEEEKLPKVEEKKDEPPPVITVKMTVQMHCEACAQVLQKRIRKIQGVESVTTDLGNNQVVVKGVVDPEKLANDVYKRTGKQAMVVKEEEVKKEEEKKEEEKKEEKKESGEEKGKEEDDKTTIDIKKNEYMTQRDYIFMEYANYSPQIFSDENPNACSIM
ncbi:heavy metal-associated isoprenylated plant protein 7-like isoform X2 [Solanum lycopersicum]|uniref:heavy metal-associated isoprenylated plant protein 7-like isoform X2 n=1 Tax=Solanum lycopersicum TaxID=4081 RepID=UPI000E1D731E|nr:heavy metal-associated isoprenylated plant protein 7-like isoform X2 [Solanum lycopersicum]